MTALRGVACEGFRVREMTPDRRQLAEALGLEELAEEGAVIPGSVVLGLGLSDADRKDLFKSVHNAQAGR